MSQYNSHNDQPKVLKIALIGDPNSGKSTLFNRLTGANQQIGNWPGVTVEQKNGKYYDRTAQLEVEVVDLPGCYSLVATDDMPLDEQVTCRYFLNNQATVYINVVDASRLSRDLYLTLQIIESGIKPIIALNCVDLAEAAGLQIDLQALAKLLDCPVVPIVARTGKNIDQLKLQIAHRSKQDLIQQNSYKIDYPQRLAATINGYLAYLNPGQTLRLLEGDILLSRKLPANEFDIAREHDRLATTLGCSLDLFIAQQRRATLNNILNAVTSKQSKIEQKFSKHIDAIVLHKIFGPLIFIAVMYLMFTVAINLGGVLQQFFDQSSGFIFVEGFSDLLIKWGVAPWLINLLVHGLGKGLNITITFIPVLAAMFLCLGILESSGYMMRAAFIVDRLMRVLGLSGKSFVPMIVGFGCNVPAIMGTRSLSSSRERILTIMMTPFMSCSARLAIYAIFVAAFFPVGGQNIIFSLYLIGILVAVLTGFALRTTVPANEASLALMEMPDYRWPLASSLLRQVANRLQKFLVKAGLLIVILCVMINGLGGTTLETIGKRLTPAFAPIGISEENWPATVGLMSGLIAKEAVIGTLNSVYTQTAGVTGHVLENTLSKTAESEMVKRFGGPIAAYAYLLFTLLYFPCVSVVAVIAKELNKKWAAFSVVWSTGLAYIIAALFYQAATWNGLLSTASAWIIGLTVLLASLFACARWMVRREQLSTMRLKPVPTTVSLTV